MSVLIVYESLFGNTEAVVRAVGEALGGTDAVEVVRADRAPHRIPAEVSLLVVAGPTHAFSMTRAGTRADAVRQGASGDAADTGIREWIEQVEVAPQLPVVTLDTRVPVRLLPGSAARSAARALRQRGFEHARAGETFWVDGTPGPLREGELDRARRWATTLVPA